MGDSLSEMNEYEKALEQLVIQHIGLITKSDTENIIRLRELIDRATPRKVFKMGIDSEYSSCPKCGQFVNCLEKFCHCCGQQLDWSKESDNK